jgi:hypothetical protein
MKIVERVFLMRLREMVEIDECSVASCHRRVLWTHCS